MSQTPLVNPFFRFDRVGPYEGRALQETPSYLRHAYLSLTLASCVCQVATFSVHVTKLRHKNYKTNKSQEATKFLTTKKSAVEHIKKTTTKILQFSLPTRLLSFRTKLTWPNWYLVLDHSVRSQSGLSSLSQTRLTGMEMHYNKIQYYYVKNVLVYPNKVWRILKPVVKLHNDEKQSIILFLNSNDNIPYMKLSMRLLSRWPYRL